MIVVAQSKETQDASFAGLVSQRREWLIKHQRQATMIRTIYDAGLNNGFGDVVAVVANGVRPPSGIIRNRYKREVLVS